MYWNNKILQESKRQKHVELIAMSKIEHLEDLTPWYINQSLSRGENDRYEAWLERHPEASVDIDLWKNIKQTVIEQPDLLAPIDVLKDTRARIEKYALTISSNRQILPALLAGLAVAVMVFSLLWFIVKPGVTLRWSIKGTSPASFRIYRAPSGSENYTLVGEVTARDNQLVYQYRDLMLIPEITYLYRVQGINSDGGVAFSQAVASDPSSILPGQLSILLTSMIMGFACLSLLKSRPGIQSEPANGVMA